ncbi:HNH endonuclease [Kurthia huakuii]|uniref:HNH endonuclease n=1 Tax=Kurthia huakuii TaxID=1421019 RepID=UPI0004B77185|nr:HNH endonuclease [Kurthia huakuii]MBM7701086.1 hypothetical protein [Kurthia huakuii]
MNGKVEFEKMKSEACAIEYILNEKLVELNKYRQQPDLNNLVIFSTPRQTKMGGNYPRSLAENYISKENSDYKCEYDDSHESFIAEGGNMYVETHYLIPMYAQDLFENTLDFADNIITLCPDCHMRLEKASVEERKC